MEAAKHKEIVELISKSGEPYEISKDFDLSDFGVQGLETNDKLVIERKAANDFWASVKDGRLWSQSKDLSKAKEEGYIPIVIIELQQLGSLAFNSKTKKRQYIETVLFKENELGFYNSELGVAKFGVHIILTSSPEGTARFLIDQSKKLGQPKQKREFPLRSGFKKSWDLKTKRLYLLEAFGVETAKALLGDDPLINFFSAFCNCEECNNLNTKEKVIDWITEIKLKSGRHIGNSKAQEIYEVIHG